MLFARCSHDVLQTFQFRIGQPGLSDEFLQFSSLEEPRVELDQVVLPEADKRRILSVVDRHLEYLACRKAWGFDEVIRYGRGMLMLFHGKPGTGKTMTARGIARHLGRRVLNVDIQAFLDKALTRRLGWHLPFPEPDAWLRARIWQSLLPDTVPVQGRLDFDRLGRKFPIPCPFASYTPPTCTWTRPSKG